MSEPSRDDLIQSVMRKARDADCRIFDLRFTDLPGTWQHFSLPIDKLEEDLFDDGLGFDGSSVRGFQQIQESDMLVVPDPATAFVDPIPEVPTLVMSCDIRDPITGESYTRDPRNIAKKAEQHLIDSGIADTSYWGPEAEFFIFNSIRYDQTANAGYFFIDSEEGVWNTGADDMHVANLGHRPRHKMGYFPVPPNDKLQDLRTQMVLALGEVGLDVEVHHHEVATAGQAEIDLVYAPLVKSADGIMLYKYIVKNVAQKAGYTVTFMPKPIFGDNGSGMHVHQSLWKDGTPLFYDETGYAMLSETARHYIGGLLRHAPSLLAFAAPTTNSYRRLVPGFEAPVNLVYSMRNRSACIRIPTYSSSPAARRVEFRPPDPTANPYLAFAALLMAGLDGIRNKIEPPPPADMDLYELEPEEAAKIQSVPGSLYEVLDALEADHEFLLVGDVFTQDVIDTWLEYKRTREADEVNLRPHPYEFMLYYDA
ncbi:MAG: type I glutamate--ammonia ligase [Chloroflexota bacterium]|nr:type I glutamate--ammonia ligase [Chloroflexota bacterium]